MKEVLHECFPSKEHCCEHGKTSANQANKSFNIDCIAPLRSNVTRVKVDGCLIADSKNKKCDWLFLVPDRKLLILVELKGEDVLYAIDQLLSTIQALKPMVNASSDKYAIVIPSKVAPAILTSIQRAKLMLKRDYGVDLHIKNRQYNFPLT